MLAECRYKGLCTPSRSKYTERMKQSGTFGDHVTLQAAGQRFNVHIFVLSSRGQSYAWLVTGISTDTGAVPTILLGHTAHWSP